jgi:hypothetical protein
MVLPPKYRVVVMMRDLEEMSVAETAGCLDITEENVKVRLHRARAMLRHAVFARIRGSRFQKNFPRALPRFAPQHPGSSHLGFGAGRAAC